MNIRKRQSVVLIFFSTKRRPQLCLLPSNIIDLPFDSSVLYSKPIETVKDEVCYWNNTASHTRIAIPGFRAFFFLHKLPNVSFLSKRCLLNYSAFQAA